jgi:hypothetical protein
MPAAAAIQTAHETLIPEFSNEANWWHTRFQHSLKETKLTRCRHAAIARQGRHNHQCTHWEIRIEPICKARESAPAALQREATATRDDKNTHKYGRQHSETLETQTKPNEKSRMRKTTTVDCCGQWHRLERARPEHRVIGMRGTHGSRCN